MSDYRHHHIVLVPVPVPAAGVDFGRQPKPPKYPHQGREHWQPRTRPNKAEALRRFLDDLARRETAAREYMKQAREAARHVRG